MNKSFCKSLDDFTFDLGLEDVGALGQTTLPDPATLEFYRHLKRREVFWNTEIDDSVVDLSLYILRWNEEDKGKPAEERQPIKIFINSDGGDLTAVMNLADMIRLSVTPVITVGMGRIYSAGGYLFMAGHRRYVFPSTSCLIHDGYAGSYGDTGKSLDNADFTRRLQERVRSFVLERTRITPEQYDANYRRDWFIFSDEMVELGVADEVVTDLSVLL